MPRHSSPITEVQANGRTRYAVRISRTVDGKRTRSQQTFDSYAEAEKALAQAKLGLSAPRSRDTFDEWADRWLELREDAGCRPATIVGYRSTLQHARGAFGSRRIQDITEDHVRALVRARRDTGAAKRSTAKMLTELRSIFALAIRRRVIVVNPADEVDALGREAKERDALTRAELGAIREAIRGDRWEAVWMVVMLGLRRSEVLGLRWFDVDFAAGTLSVERGRHAVGGEQPPKTRRGRRILPLDAERLDLLRALRAEQAELHGLAQAREGYIVLNEAGYRPHVDTLTYQWKMLCEATEGVRDDHTLHAVRHSSVTLMRNSGVPDHLVARFHGHDEAVMRSVYTHAHLEELKAATAALSFGA